MLVYLLGHQGQGALRFATIGGVVALMLCLGLFPLWPQVKFKSEIRTLRVDQQGIATKVGTWHAVIPWREIRCIAPGTEEIYIEGKNGNALIVPNRAFSAPEHRAEFLERVDHWHMQGAV
jgi:hypothetical protein